MKDYEPPRFLASGRWVEDESDQEPASLLSTVFRRRERAAGVRRSWEETMKLHDEIFARWSAYELDLAKLIDYPAMSDLREPHTVAMVKAMRSAQRLRPGDASAQDRDASGSEYFRAVGEFEEKFLIAEAEAKRIKRGHYTAAEQDRLTTARRLLNIAADESSSPTERQGAYRQLRKTVDGLLQLPETAFAALEDSTRSATAQRQPEGKHNNS